MNPIYRNCLAEFHLCCYYLDVKADDMNGPSRNQEYVHPRQVITYWLYQKYRNFYMLSKILKRDRSAIRNSVRLVTENTNNWYSHELNILHVEYKDQAA